VSAVIVTDQLVKTYGRITALKGLTLKVEKGEIFGLLGQNGAGKTTLIKVLLGIISATEGDAQLLSQPAGTADVRRRVGYLPEDHHFPEYHTGASLLDFYGALLDVPTAVRAQRIPQVLETVGIKGRMHYKVRTYSKGMKQRLGIAQALLHDPEVIFLDEPTDGVDPIGRREIRDLLQSLKKQGKTIFINSHLLGEVELICDRVAILHRGEMIRIGDIPTLTRQKNQYLVGIAEGQTFPVDDVKRIGYSVNQAGLLWELNLNDGQTVDPVVKLLVERGLHLRHLVEKRVSLEDLFMQTVDAAEPGVDERGRRGTHEVGGGGPRGSDDRPPPRRPDDRTRR
jgi:ABC-2 type transport system ATP-binding protein